MKAGASSMWSSCCGLLNEVMGTGAVRSQQPGFAASAGPFRFAPTAGCASFPPAASGSPGLTCKACGLDVSVFRRMHVCSDCKKSFCSPCSVMQENLWRCATCHLLHGTAFQRQQLMRLRVKDLRQYLLLHNVPTDTCREKADLVDLVLCHQGTSPEDEEDLDQSRPHSPFHTRSLSQQSALSVSQEESLSGTESSGTTDQEDEDEVSLPLRSLESDPSELIQARAQSSLSDLASAGDIEGLTVRELKEILSRNFVSYTGCCEKWELVERVGRLYRETEHSRKPLEKVSSSITAAEGMRTQLANPDESLCRICMDAPIDCVLLECGHMVTCTKCGKRMNECPICRQYVVRAVHVFKS